MSRDSGLECAFRICLHQHNIPKFQVRNHYTRSGMNRSLICGHKSISGNRIVIDRYCCCIRWRQGTVIFVGRKMIPVGSGGIHGKIGSLERGGPIRL